MKRKPFIGIITIIISSPVIIWLFLTVFSDKSYPPDTLGAFFLFFKGVGIAGGILLCIGSLAGYYLSICTWTFLAFYGIWKIAFEQYSGYFGLGSALIFIIIGFPFLYILARELRENKIKHNQALNSERVKPGSDSGSIN